MHDPSTPETAGATLATPEGEQQTLAPGAENATPDYPAPDYTAPDYTAPAYGTSEYDEPVFPSYSPAYYPAPPPPASAAKRALLIAAVGVGVLFMAAILAAVAIPTFLSVKAASSGTAWFNGGVAGWPTVKATGLDFTGGTIVESWQVQGANFKGPGPYMAVVRISRKVPAGETAKQYFLSLAQGLDSDGDDADVTVLSNGSPAVEWAKADGFDAGSSDFYIYANDGSSLYMVYLEASTQDFSKALDIAKPVMLNFKGTD
jgi:hypothetical protein